jgi:hypothetical protein
MVSDCKTVIFTMLFCARKEWNECDAGKTIAVLQKLMALSKQESGSAFCL